MPISLFPTRAAIGRGILPDGSSIDILTTIEFARALGDVLQRIGGANGIGNTELAASIQEITALIREIAILGAFDGAGAARAAEVAKELIRRPSILAQSGTAISLTGSLINTIMTTVPVPANMMGRNGMLRITTTWSITNSANNKTIIIKFGGTAISSSIVTTASTYQEERIIQNRNAVNSQVFVFGGAGFTGAPIGTMAKDTTTIQSIDIVAQLSDIAETITLEAYTVELLPFTI